MIKVDKILKKEGANYVWMADCLIVFDFHGGKFLELKKFTEILKKLPKNYLLGLKVQANALAYFAVGSKAGLETLEASESFKTLCYERWKAVIDTRGGIGIYDSLGKEVREWLESGDHNQCSLSLFRNTIGVAIPNFIQGEYVNEGPKNTNDFKSCLLLKEAIPYIDLDIMKGFNNGWVTVVENWEYLSTFVRNNPDKFEKIDDLLKKVQNS